MRSQEQPLEQAQSAAASEELHLAPTNPSDVPAAASCRASAEEQAAETAEDAAAASSADSVSSMLDESQGMEEMSSEPASDMHSAADEHIYSALSSPGKLWECLSPTHAYCMNDLEHVYSQPVYT